MTLFFPSRSLLRRRRLPGLCLGRFRLLGSRLLRLGLHLGQFCLSLLGSGLRLRLLRLLVMMVVSAAGAVHMAFLALEVGFEHVAGHGTVGNLCVREKEVDHLDRKSTRL